MNVEIGAEAAQFPEKEYINGIAVAVYNTITICPAQYVTFLAIIFCSLTQYNSSLPSLNCCGTVEKSSRKSMKM
jgi:hypothetical protein